MIVSSLISFITGVFSTMFGSFESFQLGTSTIYLLAEVLRYGIYIVGSDIMAMIVSSICFWWTLKLTVGLAVFIWKLLPLT